MRDSTPVTAVTVAPPGREGPRSRGVPRRGQPRPSSRANHSAVRAIPSRTSTVGSQPSSAPGPGDVGLALGGVVDREGLVDDLRRRAGDLDDHLGQLRDRELVRVADVGRAGDVGVEQGEEAPDLVVDVAEAAGLGAVAVDGDGLAPQGLATMKFDIARPSSGRIWGP